MAYVCLVLGLAIAALGAFGILSPNGLADLLRTFASSTGLYFAVAGRVIVGASLFLSARHSRTPELLQILGVIIFVSGLTLPLLGVEFLRSAIGVFLSAGAWASVVWGIIAVGFGLFIAYAVAPRSRSL